MTSLDTGFSAYYSAVFGWLVKKAQGPRRGRRDGFLVFWCFRFLVEIQKPGQGPRRGRRDGFLVFWCFCFLVESQKPGQGPRRGRRDGFLVFWCFCFLVESQNPLQGPRLRLRKAGCFVFWLVGLFEPRRRRFAGFRGSGLPMSGQSIRWVFRPVSFWKSLSPVTNGIWGSIARQLAACSASGVRSLCWARNRVASSMMVRSSSMVTSPGSWKNSSNLSKRS